MQRDNDGSLLIRARSMAYLSLTYDHRLVDGADADADATCRRCAPGWNKGSPPTIWVSPRTVSVTRRSR